MTGEPRRIELLPVVPQENEKEKEKSAKSIRLNLTLTESCDTTCPEFSYTELVKNAAESKKAKKASDPGEKNNGGGRDPLREINNDDPFAAEDDEEHDKMLAIARSFEAKYGPKPGSKKKVRSERIQDLVDLGEGYDEADPFIDNTEAYDEIVPACLTTKFGGFYVNSGVLDFREVSDSDEEVQMSHKKKKKTKRITSDDEISEVGPECGKKKRGRKKKIFKEDGEKDGFKKKRKKWSLSSGDGDKIMKKRKLDINKLKREKKAKKGLKKQKKETDAPLDVNQCLADRPKIKTTPTVAELIKQQAQTTTNGIDAKSVSCNQSLPLLDLSEFGMGMLDPGMESVINSVLNESPEDGQTKSPNPEDVPKLPTGLSERLESSIARLKKAAKETIEGKCKFFNSSVNQILLDIENRCRKLSATSRHAIYAHLAAYLPCGKETLMKRAKKLRLDAQDYLLKEPIQLLKDEIRKVMPAQLERYAVECAAAAQRMQEQGREAASTESDDEERSNDINDKRKLPRKKFEWTLRLKQLVNEIVRVKMELCEETKTRSQTVEEYLRAFLDAEIKPLWPQGWIQTRMIYKETRQTHGKWTLPAPIRVKKPMLVMPKSATGENPPSLPPGGLATSGTEPILEFDLNAPLPGGLASSGTEPIKIKPTVVEPVRNKAGPSSSPSFSGGVKRKVTGSESINVKSELKKEEKPKSSLALSIESSPSSAHMNVKSEPGTPVSTSTPAPSAAGNLLDYASNSFLQGTKSKTGVLSMGTVLPESPSASFMSTDSAAHTPAGPSSVSSSFNASLTPATDSLRSISNLLSREVQPAKTKQQHQSAEPRPGLTTAPNTSEFKPYPTTPTSTKSAVSPAEQYLNQYKEMLQQQSQQYSTTRQSPSPSTSALSPVSTSKLPEVKKSSGWEAQQMPARLPMTGALAALMTQSTMATTATTTSAAGTSLPSSAVSSSGISHSKLPGGQTQVHQVSSSLSKSHAQVTSHRLSPSIPGHDKTSPSGQRASHGQSFSSMTQQQQHPQRSSPSYNIAGNQQSSPQSQGVGGNQLKASCQNLVSSAQTVNTHTDGPSQRHSPNQNMVSSVQRSASGHGQMPRSGTPQGQKTNLISSMSARHTQGGSSSNSKSSVAYKSSLGSSNIAGTHNQKYVTNSGGASSQGQGMTVVQPRQQQQQQHSQPPKTVSPVGGYASPRQPVSPQGSSGSPSSKAVVGGTHSLVQPQPSHTNGSHGSHVSSSSGSLSKQVSLSHILKSEKNAATSREKHSKPPKVPSPSQVVYSSLTMAQILASSPSETHSRPQAQTTLSQSTPTGAFSPSPALWRTADHVTKASDLGQSAASFMASISGTRSSPPTAGIFRTPTTGARLSEIPRESPPLRHSAAPMQLNRSPDTMLPPGGLPMFGHTSPAHPSQGSLPASPQGPHHPHSPQSIVHAASPRHVLHPTALPFGYTYTDPSQPQHRY